MLRFATAAYSAAVEIRHEPADQFVRAAASGSVAKGGLKETLFRCHGSAYAIHWSSNDEHVVLQRP
jgi:hypothetical protein